MPLSRTCRRRQSSSIERCTEASVACAYLATLVSASAVTKYAHASTGWHSGSVGHAADQHRHGSARGERLERRAEPAVAEQRRVDPPRQLAQLLDRELGLLPRLRHQLGRARRIARDPRLREPEREGHGDEPLLGAVVEIALDAPALLVRGGEDALPGVAQIVDPRAQLRAHAATREIRRGSGSGASNLQATGPRTPGFSGGYSGTLIRMPRSRQVVHDVKGQFAAARKDHPEFAGKTITVIYDAGGSHRLRPQPRRSALAVLRRPRVPHAREVLADGLRGQPVERAALAPRHRRDRSRCADKGSTLASSKLFRELKVAREGRVVALAGDRLYAAGALGYNSPLSRPYLLKRIVPQLAAAVDGNPATKVPADSD